MRGPAESVRGALELPSLELEAGLHNRIYSVGDAAAARSIICLGSTEYTASMLGDYHLYREWQQELELKRRVSLERRCAQTVRLPACLDLELAAPPRASPSVVKKHRGQNGRSCPGRLATPGGAPLP